MSVLRLRGPVGADTLQRVILEGVEYSLRWRYLQLEARWSLDVSSAEGTLLAGGIRVVQGSPLLRAARSGRAGDVFPPGELFVQDPRTTGRLDPDLEDLEAGELVIYYIEQADLEARTAGAA